MWESAFGPMLIEVGEGAAFVNGQRVTSIGEMRGAAVAGHGMPPTAGSDEVPPPGEPSMEYQK